MIELKDWQKKAGMAFDTSGKRGIVEAATGSGKTFIALRYIEKYPDEDFTILVPTIVLLGQWKERIEKYLGFSPALVGDGNHESGRVVVAIVNSIRELSGRSFQNLILDECHHYLSDENVKFLCNNQFSNIMGLSATVKRSDNRNYEPFGLPIIFQYTQSDGIKAGDLCEFDIINVGVKLTELERRSYDKHDEIVKALYPKYAGQNIYAGGNFEMMRLRMAIGYRKKVLINAVNKNVVVLDIIEKHKDSKIIFFTELISAATKISKALDKLGIRHAFYHSKLTADQKRAAVQLYKDGVYKIIISVRALDEGLDVAETDVGIIHSGNRTAKQAIQRTGRILRAKDGRALLYQVYCLDTMETNEIKIRIKALPGARKIEWVSKEVENHD